MNEHYGVLHILVNAARRVQARGLLVGVGVQFEYGTFGEFRSLL